MTVTIRYSHATVRCGDVEAPAAFYRDLLGFEVSPLEGFALEIQEISTAGQISCTSSHAGSDLDELLGRRGGHAEGRRRLPATSNIWA